MVASRKAESRKKTTISTYFFFLLRSTNAVRCSHIVHGGGGGGNSKKIYGQSLSAYVIMTRLGVVKGFKMKIIILLNYHFIMILKHQIILVVGGGKG